MYRRRLFALAALAAAAPGLAHAAKVEKKKGGGASYLQLPSMNSYVLRPDGRRGVLTVDAGLDIADARLRAHAEASRPRLRAAYAQLLQIYANGLPPGRPPNADMIASEMQRETNRLLGKAGARVLLGSIMIN